MANVGTTASPARARQAALPRVGGGTSLDLATLTGVTGAFALILAAMALGGSLGSFFHPPAVLIVIGGTFMVTTASYSFREVARAQQLMLRAVLYEQSKPSAAALRVIALADRARKGGSVLELQKVLPELRGDSFLYKAVGLVVDGVPGDELQGILDRELDSTMRRHHRSAGILRRAGEVAPAMGLIGTLVGLVQMLGQLEDPSSIGPAMAVALLTTFYGAILANMIFLPLASKLERNAGVEAQVKQIYALGAASIARQENPRRLEVALNATLPPTERVRFFD